VDISSESHSSGSESQTSWSSNEDGVQGGVIPPNVDPPSFELGVGSSRDVLSPVVSTPVNKVANSECPTSNRPSLIRNLCSLDLGFPGSSFKYASFFFNNDSKVLMDMEFIEKLVLDFVFIEEKDDRQ